MNRSEAARYWDAPAEHADVSEAAQVEGVTLLGVRVTSCVTINESEHERRRTAGLSAVTNPALLDRLLDLPVDISVTDPVIWAETVDQPSVVVERKDDGKSVIRRLVPPLAIDGIVVNAADGRELSAVRDASLFAGFTRRWVAVTRSCVTDKIILEAKVSGVGLVDQDRKVLLPGERPVHLTVDGWSWLLQEKAYRRWLRQLPRARATATQAESIDGPSATRAS